jgi:hypothetical protein
MSDLKNIQQLSKEYRNASDQSKRDLQKAKTALQHKERLFEKNKRATDSTLVIEKEKQFKEEKKMLGDQIEKLKLDQKTIRENFQKQVQLFLTKLDPVTAIEQLQDNYPILLFPLRLEIRFKIIKNQHQLWLRVFPDDCNVQHKELILSESELKNVQQFWVEVWKAGGIESAERGAWTGLVNSHGSGRAAYLISEYRPTGTAPLKASAAEQFLIITSSMLLSDDEWKATSTYWIDYWLADKDVAKTQLAWNELVASTSAMRAEEITRNFVPHNINDPVPAGIGSSDVFVHRLTLPEYIPKATSWSQAPKAAALPDKFVCTLIKGSTKRTELFPNPVAETLAVGPDPSLAEAEQIQKDANGNLVVNDDLQWMVDFDKAIGMGMAMKINLSAQEYANGFDELKVMGIRLTSDEKQGKKELEELLRDHFYSKGGFELIKQGTPTNNTEELPAGYSWLDDPDESYERIFKHRENFNETEELEQKSDGERLADALGIDTDVLKLVAHANGKDQLEANAMNKALFPATMGYFMEEMMNPLFTDDDIHQTKQFFSGYVSGRGPIPAICIGKQPYGILPATVYSRMHFLDRQDPANVRKAFIPRLHKLIMKLDAEWQRMSSSVPYVGKPGSDPHQLLLDVIGLHANSAEFHQRYAQTVMQLYNQLTLTVGSALSGIITAGIAERGKTILRSIGIDPEGLNIPILEKVFFEKPNLLKGPLVDDVPESETTPIRNYSANGQNYIEWLASSGANNVRMENFGGNKAPTALLYIMLRHSLMQAQSDAATRFLVSNKLITSKSVYFDPDFIHVEAEGKGKSKFEHLYSPFPGITGDSTTVLAEHIYKPEVMKQRKETLRLNETLEALKILEKVPTARLEGLFTEHLDCCNYRLDAWITGLVNYKLQEQRRSLKTNQQKSKGIYLGAYGWLLNVKPENKILHPVQLTGELKDIFTPQDGSALVSDANNLGFIHAPSINQAATAAILRNAYDSNKTAGSGNPFSVNLSSDRVRVANTFLEGIRNGQSLGALLGYYFERGLHDKHGLGQGEVDKFIYPLRKVFPLVADQLEDTKTKEETSIESIEARNVVDGLKLIRHVQEASVKAYPFGIPSTKGLPNASTAEAKAIGDEVKAITEINDAVSDLVMAEQVYQTVLDNAQRAAGNADAFSKGSYPPVLDVMNTPRSGITITNRVAIQLNALATAAPGANPRSVAEPALSEWLLAQFPLPENVGCKVSYSTPVQPEASVTVTQQELGLDAMDLLYLLQSGTEQAMTELDDRIVNYVRYQIAKHPHTQVFIHYTDAIDTTDRSQISLFELSALVTSLRKLVKGNRYLKPSHLALSQAGETVVANLNDVLLKQRVNDTMNAFQLALNALNTLQTNVNSIASLSSAFQTSLELHINDTTLVNSLVVQMQSDLKNYLKDSTPDIKDAQLQQLEVSLNVIGNPATIANLKTIYTNALDTYAGDFLTIDALIKDVCNSFEEVALYRQSETGTGFMMQAVQSVYNSVYAKCTEVIKRWQQKRLDVDAILLGYDAGGVPEEQFALLQKAEQLLSVQLTTPLPGDFKDYKTNVIDGKKNAFDALLSTLQSHFSNAKTKVTDFILDVETSLISFSSFDAIKFDQKENRNDLASEKLILAQLQEDMAVAMSNVWKAGDQSIADCTAAIAEADKLLVNSDKVETLLKAGKCILGDEAVWIPQFTLDTTTGNELEKIVQAGLTEELLQFSKTVDKRILPVEDWLGGVARVKANMHEWEQVSCLIQAFKPGSNCDLLPLQLPYETNDRWLGLKFKDESDPGDAFKINGDKLLYTVHFAKAFDKNSAQCGIIVDDWTEVIPNEKETTGVAFHYDQPNSEPPQTMLLVTPPQQTGHWQWKDLEDCLSETLQLAKKRAVEPSQIEASNYAQFLPSTMMAVSMHWITVASNLSMNNEIYKFVSKT